MLKHMHTNPNTAVHHHSSAANLSGRTQPDGMVMMTDLPPGHPGTRMRGPAVTAAPGTNPHSPPVAPLMTPPHPHHSQQQLNMSMRLNHSHALNVSTLNASKHSLGNSSSVSPGGNGSGVGLGSSAVSPVLLNGPVTQIVTPLPGQQGPPKLANGGLNIPRGRTTSFSAGSMLIPANVSRFMTRSKEAGIKEMLTSLGLLCLVSLLLALLSLIFLLKISPMASTDVRDLLRTEQLTVISPEEYMIVYEVTLALCALTLSLNLCCLLVCAVQFLFAVKLVRSLEGGERTNKYLQKSSITRVCAVGGFFVSIPVFLTGIILYTFIQFHSTPAIITSVLIGLGIIFCGCAMVHNVFVWQREKTNAVRELAQQQQHSMRQPTPPTPQELNKLSCHPRDASGSVSPGMPPAMLDLSSVTTATPHELSTLV